LKRQCPTPALRTKVFMDSTPHKFDSHYFLGLIQGKGVMSSDQALMENPRTRRSVYAYRNPSTFSRDFASAMVAMSQIQVLTGHQGEIRRHMSVVNHH
jgi:peroxidase